jgi:obg-like ATPase 1
LKVKAWIDENDQGAMLIPFSGKFESTAIKIEQTAKAEFFKESGATSALNKITNAGYKALNLEYFFTYYILYYMI